MNAITTTNDEVLATLPPGLVGKVEQATLDKIRDMYNDPDMCEQYRDNFVSWQDVIDGRVTLDRYADAVKYVSLKMIKDKNKEAFALTFPDKINDWIARGVPTENQDAYVSNYNRSRLVQGLWERSMIPVHVLHYDSFNRAVKTQLLIMDDTNASFTARVKAADSVLTHTKPPETQKIEVSDTRETTELDALKNSVAALVEQQANAIAQGNITAKEAAESSIFGDPVDAEFTEVDDEDVDSI